MYRNFFKRLIDILLSFIGLVAASPVLLVVTLLLAIANHGKPFFFQLRPGRNGRIFRIVKFKTMNDKRDKQGNLLPDAQRLTPVGRLVRKTSLDEIPQLINVLKGDMSLIGPRPLLVQYIPYYTERESKRHSVKPGITGLAQVNGRNNLNWDDRLEMDVRYIETLSLQLDLKILIKTIKNVIFWKDVVVIPGEKFTTLDNYRRKQQND